MGIKYGDVVLIVGEWIVVEEEFINFENKCE